MQPLVPKSNPGSRIVKDKIKDACVKYVCQDLHPFAAAGGTGFISLVQEISRYILSINIIQ